MRYYEIKLERDVIRATFADAGLVLWARPGSETESIQTFAYSERPEKKEKRHMPTKCHFKQGPTLNRSEAEPDKKRATQTDSMNNLAS